MKIPDWLREIYGKTLGWEQVHRRAIRDFRRTSSLRRGISRKLLPTNRFKRILLEFLTEEEDYLGTLLPAKNSVRIPGWEREYTGKLQASLGKHIPSRKSLVSGWEPGKGLRLFLQCSSRRNVNNSREAGNSIDAHNIRDTRTGTLAKTETLKTTATGRSTAAQETTGALGSANSRDTRNDGITIKRCQIYF